MLWNTFGNMQTSQEHFTTIVYAKFGWQTEYIMGNWELENRPISIYIVYVIESVAYGVLFTSYLCRKPERARTSTVRVFDTVNEWIQPPPKHFLSRELFITHKTRIFGQIVFWTQISTKCKFNSNGKHRSTSTSRKWNAELKEKMQSQLVFFLISVIYQ